MMDALRARLGVLRGGRHREDRGDQDAGTDTEAWPYEWTEERVEKVHGEPVISHAAEDDPETVFAGPLARKMIEGPRHDPDQPLYVGLGTRKGRHVGIERQYLFRHTAVFGTTGYGKSTLLKNAAKQVIESGAGCCFIDPKGQDSIELMQVIPDHRLNDVVWIEPGQARSAVTGFNFLEVGVGEDHPMYDTAVENVVRDLVRMVGLDDYWGPLMDGVCSNLIRGTTRLERDFNLLDLYYILISADAREQYAAMLEAEGLTFLADYAEKIEEMDDDDLDALQRRFKDWVEDPLARSAVAHRNTDIDMESIVGEGKILVVRMAEHSEELKQMIGTAILRRIWSTVRSRAATYDTEYDPFFLFADEFDLLATQDSSVTTMLSKARSLSLALFLCCQNPSQLPQNVVDAMYANCDTVLSFSPGSPKDARAVAKNLDMDPETLRHESNYHVWTQLTLSETRERSEAFRTYCLPPFPPVRRESEALHAIEMTVRALGRPPLSDDEMRRGLILGGEGVNADLMAGEWSGVSTEAEQEAVAQGVHDAACRVESPDGYVTADECRTAVARRLAALETTPDDVAGRLGGGDLYRRALQHVRDDLLDVRTGDGEGDEAREAEAKALTPRSTIASVGEDQSGGGAGHALLMWDAYAPLTWAGLDVTISEASGDDADALARPAPPDEQNAPELVERLTGGGEVRAEAEHSTGKSKAGMTAQHVMQAANEGRRTIVLSRPGDAQNVADTLRTEPVFCRSDHDAEGEMRFYTSPRDLRVDGEAMTRPGSRENVWVRDDATGEIVLRDDAGAEHARFEDAEAVFRDANPYPEGGERTIKRPVIPDHLLDADAEPRAEILAVDANAETLADLSLVVDTGQMTVPADAVGRDGEARVPAADLDVSDGAKALLRHLRADPDAGPWTTADAHDLAHRSDDETVHVSDRTIRNYLGALADAGALDKEPGNHAADPARYHLK